MDVYFGNQDLGVTFSFDLFSDCLYILGLFVLTQIQLLAHACSNMHTRMVVSQAECGQWESSARDRVCLWL